MSLDGKTMRERGVALLRLEEETEQLERAKERHERLISEALAAGCSLRQVGEAAGMSFSGLHYRIHKNGAA